MRELRWDTDCRSRWRARAIPVFWPHSTTKGLKGRQELQRAAAIVVDDGLEAAFDDGAHVRVVTELPAETVEVRRRSVAPADLRRAAAEGGGVGGLPQFAGDLVHVAIEAPTCSVAASATPRCRLQAAAKTRASSSARAVRWPALARPTTQAISWLPGSSPPIAGTACAVRCWRTSCHTIVHAISSAPCSAPVGMLGTTTHGSSCATPTGNPRIGVRGDLLANLMSREVSEAEVLRHP